MQKSKDNDNEDKPYYDARKFKGNTFEQNVATINNMLFGQGLKISDTPFIIIDKDNRKYLITYSFKFEFGQNIKVINLPESFLQYIFYFDEMLFHLDSGNNLVVFKFINNICYKYQCPNTYNKNATLSRVKMEITESTINLIKEKLKKIEEKNKLTEKYDILYDIFKNDLKYKFHNENPKAITGQYEVSLKHSDFKNKYKCIITKNILEIDGSGKIRKKINLEKGKISFNNGINCLKQYINLKKNPPSDTTKYIKNDFMCPIIFKNFDDGNIPENKVILCEIKSGFAINDVQMQLKERIDIINNCSFNIEEKPLYYIAIVNFLSNNVKLLDNIVINPFEVDEKVLFVATIDYEYCGIDISHEIHGNYILYEKIDSVSKDVKETKEKVTQVENYLKSLNNKFDETNLYLKQIFSALVHYHPDIKNYIKPFKSKTEEEKNGP